MFKNILFKATKLRNCRETNYNRKKIIFTTKKNNTMNKMVRKIGFMSVIAVLLVMGSCKKKDPSILKVFVRSANNELVNNAKVILIADVDSEPATPAYVDTVQSNSSGFATFDMQEFFDLLGKKETTGYFDVLVKKDTSEGSGYIRCRAHITNVITINLN